MDRLPGWYLRLLEKEPSATWNYASRRLEASRKKIVDQIKKAAQDEER